MDSDGAVQKVKTSGERPDICVTDPMKDGGRCHLQFSHTDIETHCPLACFEFTSPWGQKQYFKLTCLVLLELN